MKNSFLCALAIACLSVCALGQNVRVGPIPFPSVSSSAPPFLVANLSPNSPVLAVCKFPANAVPCSNYQTTYTGAGVACTNGAQDTPDPNSATSACQATGDAQGNIGFWVPPGKYDYTICIQTTCLGPYTVTVNASPCPTCVTSQSALNPGFIVTGAVGQQVSAGINFPLLQIASTAGGSAIAQGYSTSGTTGVGLIVKLTSSNTVVTVGTGDTEAIGICNAQCQTGGTSEISIAGSAGCIFDNTATVGHYVQISSGTAGNCHDVGAAVPTSGSIIIGRVIDSGAAGSHSVALALTPPATAAVQGSVSPAYIGDWENTPYTLSSVTIGSISTSSPNQLQIWMFRLTAPFSFNTLTIQTSSVSGNPAAGFGVYSATGNQLIHWDNLTLALNNHTYQITPTGGAVVLQPGYYYWACAVSTSTSETIAGALLDSGSGESVKPWNISVARTGFAGNVMSAGILPATLGVLTAGAQGGSVFRPVWTVEP